MLSEAVTAPAYARVVHVVSLGVSVLKGAAQRHPTDLELAVRGPVGDRVFCCVDPVVARVLRTVENPGLLALRAQHSDGRLVVDVPGTGPVAAPVVVAHPMQADYWGRSASLDVLDGPWAAALSAHLGREVVLARARPRDVVYGGGVTLVTTSSLFELSRRAGLALSAPELIADAERWRATIVVDTGETAQCGAAAFVEDGWVGRRLSIGQVVLEVHGRVPRCAVVRMRPGSGAREPWDPLALLARDRARDGEIDFGVEAEVVTPGRVAVADPVALV